MNRAAAEAANDALLFLHADTLLPDGACAAVLDALASGASNRELRTLLKANFDLANKVQHARAATLDEAAIVAEATGASVNLMRVLILGASPIESREDAEEIEEVGLL